MGQDKIVLIVAKEASKEKRNHMKFFNSSDGIELVLRVPSQPIDTETASWCALGTSMRA